tara:strand:- start:362 stop:655 length:294 start_codon:yes stop_codon:yes gene_type:complete
MEFVDDSFRLQTNLDEDNFDKLQNGVWKIGLIADNPGIDDESNNTFYETVQDDVVSKEDKRCFKNIIPVVLYDNSTVTAHLIHWHKPGGWFCVSFDA